MGSSVALLAGLAMTLAVFLLMPDMQDRLSGEYPSLLRAIAWAILLVVTSATAFVGQLKEKSWRIPAHVSLAAAVLLVGWNYWPG
jgi:cytochrome bd-type quinol oxidase subunit 2